jgi:hypothetical protein
VNQSKYSHLAPLAATGCRGRRDEDNLLARERLENERVAILKKQERDTHPVEAVHGKNGKVVTGRLDSNGGVVLRPGVAARNDGGDVPSVSEGGVLAVAVNNLAVDDLSAR